MFPLSDKCWHSDKQKTKFGINIFSISGYFDKPKCQLVAIISNLKLNSSCVLICHSPVKCTSWLHNLYKYRNKDRKSLNKHSFYQWFCRYNATRGTISVSYCTSGLNWSSSPTSPCHYLFDDFNTMSQNGKHSSQWVQFVQQINWQLIEEDKNSVEMTAGDNRQQQKNRTNWWSLPLILSSWPKME